MDCLCISKRHCSFEREISRVPQAYKSIVIPLRLFFTFCLSLGCGPGLINKSELLRNQLEFLSIGKTTEQEVLTRLGEPENRYEGGTVLTCELREDTNHRLLISSLSFRTHPADDSLPHECNDPVSTSHVRRPSVEFNGSSFCTAVQVL